MSRIRSQNYKKFKFKSSGQSIGTEVKYQNDTFRKKLIGIKTPLELGSGRDGLLKMHDSLKEQIKDNLKNLLLTNHGERLGNYDFGANLDELLFEFSSEDFEAEALSRVTSAVGKYMPFVSIQNVETFTETFNNEHTAKIGIKVVYGIPQLELDNQAVSLILRVAG